jgi:hypothetical protein
MPLTNWVPAGATLATAMVMGVSLGSYAISQPKSAVDQAMEESLYDPSISTQTEEAMAMRGPAEVKCTGCGPTLAERQWRADMAGWDPDGIGRESADPVVRDYLADDPVEESAPPAPPPVEQLPANIVRFASSDVAGRPVPEAHMLDDEGKASPPPLLRTAAAAMP